MHIRTMPKAGLSQFFTTSPKIKATILKFVDPNGTGPVLEPGAGRGHLVELISEQFPARPIDAVEIDTSLVPLEGAKSKSVTWRYADFLSWSPSRLYTLVLGNPPYGRTAKGCLQVMFAAKAFGALAAGGEMVMVVPSDFFRLTQTANLLGEMLKEGHFTHVWMSHDEGLFEGACVDTMVFRYERAAGLGPWTCVNGMHQRLSLSHGTVTFVGGTLGRHRLGDRCDVRVGLVSGCEQAYKSEAHGNVVILTKKAQRTRYIMAHSALDPLVIEHLLPHKPRLLARRMRPFGESNWFEWGALRNHAFMTGRRAGDECLYVYLLTRGAEVCFRGEVELYGARLLSVVPRHGESVDLSALCTYLNSKVFRSQYTHAGRFKIGQRQLANALIPPGIMG